MDTIKNVIFDLGGVLVDWNPEYVYLDVFDGNRKKMQWFFDEICTFDWNENQDAGYPLAQASADRIKLFPQYEQLIRMFYDRWEEMLGGQIDGTVAILKRLVVNPDYKVIALTNWSAETFPIALKRFEFLHWFEGIVVSGAEKTRKPFLDIYQITLDRYQLNPKKTLFIDDNKRNIEAAQKFGIHTIQFQNPIQLQISMEVIGIKI
tara:strand:+ start:204 stop:821 length:618 start_codon:yes stop_codon:yes gene_type:complete